MKITLTTPHCPRRNVPGEVELRVAAVPGSSWPSSIGLGSTLDPQKSADEARLIGNAMPPNEIRPRPAPVLLTPAAEARNADLMAARPMHGRRQAVDAAPLLPGLAYSFD